MIVNYTKTSNKGAANSKYARHMREMLARTYRIGRILAYDNGLLAPWPPLVHI